MADEEHLKILRQGVKVWNRWREDNPEVVPKINYFHMPGFNLIEVNFIGAYLSNSLFFSCDLTGANLKGIHLAG